MLSEIDRSSALESVAEAHGGRLWRSGRLWVLETNGSPGRRGLQHGVLLSEAIKTGVVPVLATRVASLPVLAGSAAHVDRIYEIIRESIPCGLTDEVSGIAQGADLDDRTVFRASFLSEALQVLAGLSSRARSAAQAAGGCTAAVVAGSRTKHGAAIHAKNQDYDGAGAWDRAPLVHLARPDEGLAFVTATSAGLLKGNLALNAAGVSIGGHFLFSKNAGISGAGFTALEREVALRARTVDEAIDVLTAKPALGSFAFVVADACGRAVVAECDGDGVSVRRAEDDAICMANVFVAAAHNDALRPARAHRNPSGRQARMEALLAGHAGLFDATILAHFLADRFDIVTSRRRGPAPTIIAQPSTVTSAIADTGTLTFWVSEGTAPTSHGDFIGFALAEAFRTGAAPTIEGSISGASPEDGSRIAAMASFMEARKLFRSGGDADVVEAALREAERLDPQEPAYSRFCARARLRAGDAHASLAHLQRSAALNQGLNELAECALLSGYAHDLLGDRSTARTYYESIRHMANRQGRNELDWVNPRLVQLAHIAFDRGFDDDQAATLDLPFDLISGIE